MNAPNHAGGSRKASLFFFALLVGIFAFLFWRSFFPGWVVFSNDGPLGAMVAEQNRMPTIMTGMWMDLNWIGAQYATPSPSISSAMRLISSPWMFSKFFCPAALMVLGLCAWLGFRQMKLSPLACVLGGLAAALSSHFFSTACWGVAAQVICVGMNFVAVGLLTNSSGKGWWAKVILAGMCVGMGVMEGYDIGAIFSLFVAAFALWESWSREGALVKKLGRGIFRTALVAAFAGFIAAQAVTTLVGTQVKGVVGMAQDPETKARRWEQATWVSYPPTEILRVVIPGLFGYRMDTPKDMEMFGSAFDHGAYWGRAGETPGHYNHRQGNARFSGGGEYAGILVVLVALWAVAQSLLRQSVFTATQKKLVWFWAIAALVSMLLMFGHYAPFYRLFYALPFASTIRNPAKFTHTFHWAMVILFAYGIHGLSRRYLDTAVTAVKNAPANLQAGWARVNSFDRKWIKVVFALVGASILGWLIYAASAKQLQALIRSHEMPELEVPKIAAFSIREVGSAVLFLTASVIALTLVMRGHFSGNRARLGGIWLGVVLVVDLCRANLPWILQWDYTEKYDTKTPNPVVEFLRQKPFEHRVAMLSAPFQMPPELPLLAPIHNIEWAQHHFLYYNIQSLDRIQEPRVAADNQAFRATMLTTSPLRQWELTNTRYVLAANGYAEALNAQVDKEKRQFRTAMTFNIQLRPGTDTQRFNEFYQRGIFLTDKFTAVATTNGPYAVLEFTGALPRAKLCSNWRVATNDPARIKQWIGDLKSKLPRDFTEPLDSLSDTDAATLIELANPAFDPSQTVLLAAPVAQSDSAGTNGNSGSVEFASYAPKRIVLKAKADKASVLLLNDKYDPGWQVTVDGKSEALLRCNYILRGVQVPAGEHTIEFVFKPSTTGLKISLLAIAIGLALIGFLAFRKPEDHAGQK